MSDRLLKESDVMRIAFQLPLVVNSAFADAVKALPSADRPQEWIPCEERLPEEEGNYLVTFGAYEKEIKGEKFIFGNIDRGVSVVGFGCCQRDITGKPIGFGWYDLSSATYYDKQSVLAWMPLPKPWKGATDGNK